jgi:hypothetical protein
MALPLAVGLTLVTPISAGLASQGLRILKTMRGAFRDNPKMCFSESPPEGYTTKQQDRI